MYNETLYDVVIINNSEVAVKVHPCNIGHVTGVFNNIRDAKSNARKLSRQHNLKYTS